MNPILRSLIKQLKDDHITSETVKTMFFNKQRTSVSRASEMKSQLAYSQCLTGFVASKKTVLLIVVVSRVVYAVHSLKLIKVNYGARNQCFPRFRLIKNAPSTPCLEGTFALDESSLSHSSLTRESFF